MIENNKESGAEMVPVQNTDTENSIQYWMKKFEELYGEVDSKRSPVEIWVAATAHFSTMCEAIRRVHFYDLMNSAAHAFCWMCSFILSCHRLKDSVFTLKDSFSDIVASKYPLVCGHCQGNYCHCNPKLIDSTTNKATNYKELLHLRSRLVDAPNTYSISKWSDIFNSIYGQHIHMLTLDSIGFHFIEEAGEELTALRSLMQLRYVLDAKIEGIDTAFFDKLSKFETIVDIYGKYANKKLKLNKTDPEAVKARLVHAKVDMFIEFADTFSWFCSVLNKVMSIAANCKDNCRFSRDAFSESLNNAYFRNGELLCPSCQKCPCECVFYNSRITNSIPPDGKK